MKVLNERGVKMALAYLLDPVFQIENTAGKPASGGWLEVYVAGSREKYYCASDFDGTLHPFRIELDSLGANIVLADDSQSYDVYVYNRYGGLLMSRYNVSPSNGGGGVSLSTITSTDGSIIVTQTANGVDLRVDSEAPSTMRCTATSLLADDVFDFSELQRDGQNAFVNNGEVVVNEGWWHYDITARLRWPGNPAENVESEISLYCVNGSDSVSFDRSYGHDETLQLSGEFKSTQDGTAFNVGVSGIPSGMTVELVDFGIHSIIGNGAGGKYDAGTGIDIDEPNRIISVDFDEVQAKLTAGDGVTIDSDNEISVDTSVIQRALSPGNGISLDSDDNITVKVDGDSITFNGDGELQANFPAQQQANWTEADNTSVQYIQNKPTNLVQDASYVHTDNNFTDADVSKLAGIAAGAEVNVQSDWTEADNTADSYIKNKPAETTLAAGNNITITESGSTLTIAATAAPQQQANWTEADNTSVQYIQNKPANLVQDASYVHTDNNFTNSDVSKLAGIAAGAEVNVQSDWTEADNTADSYIQHKPTEKSLVAGSNITLTEAANSVTIAATVPAQQQADWTEADNTDPSYIQNKPSLATVATSGSYTDLLNTPDLSLKEDVANKAQSVSVNSQTDYPSSYAVANYVNSSVSTNTAKFLGNFTLSDLSLTYPATDAQIETALDGYAFSPAPTNNDYVYVEIQDPLTPGVTDVVKRFKYDGSNWLYEYSLNNSSFTAQEIAAIDSGVTATKVSNYDTHIADTTIHVTSTDKTTWNGKQDAISDLQTIRTGAGLGATAVQPGDLATVATSGDYDDLLNKPTIPAAQVQSDWTEADNTSVSYIQNKPSLATVATSGLYSDLSGTPSLATVATSGDYDDLINKPSIPAAQVQSDWTEADNTDPSYIQNKPTLATVATSGLYSDLSGTPSLATVATSGDYDDLLNKPSIPAAQVQSNWTEADNTDPSYIQNKPALATVATSGLYSDLSGTPTINNVPAVTSSDDNKVLKASYTGGVGSYSWEQESGGTVTDVEVDGVSVVSGGVASITTPTVDQVYDGTSTNAQSGTAVADALANINQVPTSTSADSGKVLTVNAQGVPGWVTGGGGGGVQSDWTEADPASMAYIQNKPTPKTLTAGDGIAVTESASAINVSADVSALSAAQIQALKEALGVDETVLFESSAGIGTGTQLVLSEAYTNFEKLQFVYRTWSDDTIDVNTFGSGASIFTLASGWTSSSLYALFITTYTATDTTHLDVTKCGYNNVTGSAWTTSNSNYRLYKVVGIHRIANN